MWHFDRSLEHTDKAIYFGALSMGEEWIKEIIQKSGAKTLYRIDKLLGSETLGVKADYMDKIYCRMNVANCDLLMRIAFQIAKVNLKLARTFHDTKQTKLAYPTIVKANQYLNIYYEVLQNNKAKYSFMSKFTTDEKSNELECKIRKLDTIL